VKFLENFAFIISPQHPNNPSSLQAYIIRSYHPIRSSNPMNRCIIFFKVTRGPVQTNPTIDMAPQNLGELAKLPAELRQIIWQNVGPQNGSGPKPSMGVLRTCRQLYDEVFPIMYNNEVLCFKVAPRYQYRSWISVSNRCGAAWTLESSDDALSHGYNKLPYSRLRAVRIEVEAPDPFDPGQLICVWKKVRELVELLGQAGQLPDLEINLLKSPRASWMGFGRPQ
jgi:hypothetical protein